MELETFYRRVAQKLAIVEANQAMTAEDRDLIVQTHAIAHALCDALGLVTWSLEDTLPPWAGLAMVDVVAAMLVDEFGVPEPRRSTLRIEGMVGLPVASMAERVLRKGQAVPPAEKDDPVYY